MCGLDSSGTREGPVVGSCERGNEYSRSAVGGNFLVRNVSMFNGNNTRYILCIYLHTCIHTVQT